MTVLYKMASSNNSIASGFEEDCNKLIFRFESLNNLRYKGFCEIWRDMQFSLVFTCRQSFGELVKFCEEALLIAKKFILPPRSFKERVGGLYLLYGIYFKMPIVDVRIRVTLEDWKHIMKLRKFLREGEHHDANYILSKLIIERAFIHCVFDQEYALEKDHHLKDYKHKKTHSVLPAIKALTESHELLERMDKLSKVYQQKKCALSNDTKPERGLDLYNENIGETIIKDINTFEEEIRRLEDSDNPSKKPQAIETQSINLQSKLESKNCPNKPKCSVTGSKIRAHVGDGFDSDSLEESFTCEPMEEYDPNLPGNFEDSSEESM
ncbi:snRNA-activating protein complex subunit 1 [Orussus abietinus]|uniref:snRNA-activating protein complex subunit 1 n=1 Tax=Orussus abietinus TaxID=222816 RepID=UPI0006263ADE|nr:snRNA-activating protein complex subunit 1 [Orussus abietinus]